MSQAGNDSNNLTKFRSNIINVKFPGQMAINEYSQDILRILCIPAR